jgi:hypothetical protein
VEDLGVGVQLPGARQLLAGTGTAEGRTALRDRLVAGLQRITQPSFRSRCQQVAAQLRCQPDGLQVAAQHVLEALASSKACTVVASAPAALGAAHSTCSKPKDSSMKTNQPVDATAQRADSAQLELAPGFSIYTSCPEEAEFIFNEVYTERCYLRHGITVNAGDVIIDCGACQWPMVCRL